jgi:GT2 family glycosyltransferase
MSVATYTILDESMRRRYGSDTIRLDQAAADKLIKGKYIARTQAKEAASVPGVRDAGDRGHVRVEPAVDTASRGTKPRIQVMIPYEPGCNVGWAYNRAMREVDGWALIIDHDILMVNPLWYDMCLAAIEQVGNEAGWLTCYTNRIGCPLQVAPSVNTENHDIGYHRDFAKALYRRHGNELLDHTHEKHRYSGLFILTHKKAWEKVGGFKEDSFFHIDVDYCTKLRQAGFKTMLMSGLYVYHGYFRETLHPFFTKG